MFKPKGLLKFHLIFMHGLILKALKEQQKFTLDEFQKLEDFIFQKLDAIRSKQFGDQ